MLGRLVRPVVGFLKKDDGPTAVEYAVVLALIVAVIICDWLLHRAQTLLPSLQGIRVFAFVAPALLYGAYFFALLLTEGSRWSIHLIGGAIVLPGIAGWLLKIFGGLGHSLIFANLPELIHAAVTGRYSSMRWA